MATCAAIAVARGISGGAMAIPDDARQFFAWTVRLSNPSALPGDLITDYWQAVSPPLYRLLLRAAFDVGISPIALSHVLVAPLLLLSAWLGWRIATQLSGDRRIAFLSVALMLAGIALDDSIFSATPRAFGPVLILFFLDGLLRKSWEVVPALLLLACVYPAPALVCLTMLALSHIRWRPLSIDLSPRALAIAGAAVLATGTPILGLKSETKPWGPTLTLQEAKQMPNLMDRHARSHLTGKDGKLSWVCGSRLGFLPPIVPCKSNTDPRLLVGLFFLFPQVALGFLAIRRARRHGKQPPELIYAYALIAALFWYLVAAGLAFQLHLPSRYSQRLLSVTEGFAFGQWLGLLVITSHKLPHPRHWVRALGLLALVPLLFPTVNLRRPHDPEAIRMIAALPANARVAGVSEELNYVPALAGRSVLATAEHAIPYHLGYFRPLEQRLAASVEMARTPDPQRLAALLAQWKVDVFMVDRDILAGGKLSKRYKTLVPASVQQGNGSPAMLAAAPGCVMHAGSETLLLNARCLSAASSSKPHA